MIHPSGEPRKTLRHAGPRHPSVLVIAEQTSDAIRRRRAIRETFHDSKAVTIRKNLRDRRQAD